MDDLDQVGGKNASLGEMVAQPDRPRGQRARRVRHHGRRLPPVHRRRRPGGPDRRAARGPRHRRHPRARRGRASEIRGWIVEQAFPDDLEADIRDGLREAGRRVRRRRRRAVVRRALQRHGRGPARRVVRRAAGDLPQRARHRRGAARRSARSSPRSTTTGRSPTACTTGSSTTTVALSAGVQRMVRSDIGASGVMFTMDTESGFDDAVFITSAYGLGEGVVQGAVNPDEFYVYKPALRAERPAILKRGIGGKATKMIYTDDADGRQDHRVRRRRRGRRAAVQPDRRRGRGAGPARADHRGALRPADGHRVGQGRPRREALRPAGPAGDRAVAAVGGALERFKIDQVGDQGRVRAGRGSRDRPEDRRRRRPRARLARGDARLPARARCSSPT